MLYITSPELSYHTTGSLCICFVNEMGWNKRTNPGLGALPESLCLLERAFRPSRAPLLACSHLAPSLDICMTAVASCPWQEICTKGVCGGWVEIGTPSSWGWQRVVVVPANHVFRVCTHPAIISIPKGSTYYIMEFLLCRNAICQEGTIKGKGKLYFNGIFIFSAFRTRVCVFEPWKSCSLIWSTFLF